ncbi:MAG TPA: hypothetical protein VHC22_00185 [Pirellulales bacterium]|nr:hypothetical protein [Pirellulales bacterium]
MWPVVLVLLALGLGLMLPVVLLAAFGWGLTRIAAGMMPPTRMESDVFGGS